MTRGADLQEVRREGKRIRTEHLEVRALASLLLHPRVGFIVPRYKHSAVDRNRLKRRLREIARTRLLPGLPPVDFVIRVLPHAYAASFDALGSQLERCRDRVARAAAAGSPPRPQHDAAAKDVRDQGAAPGTTPPRAEPAPGEPPRIEPPRPGEDA